MGLVLSIKYQMYIIVVIAAKGYQYIYFIIISETRMEFYELSKNHSTNFFLLNIIDVETTLKIDHDAKK